MKMTIVTDAKGQLVAAQQGTIRQPGKHDGSGAVGGLMAGPGQNLHEIDVPDQVAKLQDAAAFLKGIRPHLPH